MRSAYVLLGSGPLFATYTNNFTYVLHYLWHSLDSVAATALMGILDNNTLFGREPQEREGSWIPNSWWSSEHVTLVAEFSSYLELYKFLRPRLLQDALIPCTKCDCTLSCCLCSLLYTIHPPDKSACRNSFFIIRGICNQPGVHFACKIKRSTYFQSINTCAHT